MIALERGEQTSNRSRWLRFALWFLALAAIAAGLVIDHKLGWPNAPRSSVSDTAPALPDPPVAGRPA